jgi:hypothetical protein
MAPTEAVCDARPLIHLDEMDSLDLLADFGAVMVPEAVWAKVQPKDRSSAPVFFSAIA